MRRGRRELTHDAILRPAAVRLGQLGPSGGGANGARQTIRLDGWSHLTLLGERNYSLRWTLLRIRHPDNLVRVDLPPLHAAAARRSSIGDTSRVEVSASPFDERVDPDVLAAIDAALLQAPCGGNGPT